MVVAVVGCKAHRCHCCATARCTKQQHSHPALAGAEDKAASGGPRATWRGSGGQGCGFTGNPWLNRTVARPPAAHLSTVSKCQQAAHQSTVSTVSAPKTSRQLETLWTQPPTWLMLGASKGNKTYHLANWVIGNFNTTGLSFIIKRYWFL